MVAQDNLEMYMYNSFQLYILIILNLKMCNIPLYYMFIIIDSYMYLENVNWQYNFGYD